MLNHSSVVRGSQLTEYHQYFLRHISKCFSFKSTHILKSRSFLCHISKNCYQQAT